MGSPRVAVSSAVAEELGDVNVGLAVVGGGVSDAVVESPGEEFFHLQVVESLAVFAPPVVVGFAVGGDEGGVEISEDAEGAGDIAEESGFVAVVAGSVQGVDDHHMGDGAGVGGMGLCDIGSGGDEDADDFGMQTGGGDEEDGNGVVVFGVGGGILGGEDASDFGKGGGGFFDFGDEGGVCGLGDEFGGGV